MYYFYLYNLKAEGSYKYGEAHPAPTLEDAVKGAKALMRKRRDRQLVMISKADVQKDATVYRNAVGRVVRHSKGILYNPRNSTLLYLIQGNGEHTELVADLREKTA